MATKSLSELLDGSSATVKTAKQTLIPSMLFKAQIDAKLTHLSQPDKTLALHEAMAKFYDGIDDLLDTFVETYTGLYSLTITTEGSAVIMKPVVYFTDLYNTIDKERQSIKESFLQNQIDEIQQLIAHTLYRLKKITD